VEAKPRPAEASPAMCPMGSRATALKFAPMKPRQKGFVPLYGVLVASFFCLGFMGANFNAVALEPMGHIAGLASAGLGFASTSLAAFFGGFIGQHFDGTAWPFALGFFGLGAAALVVVAHAERGRLDVPYV
ncbi:MAG: hypothetical protein AAFU79_37230, partial [Myxococcota bacterium]